uniref:Uncharacterized protein n=1 Tax=Arundo donax TaxID=35708 RepID=A0A0A9BH78_ARUDO
MLRAYSLDVEKLYTCSIVWYLHFLLLNATSHQKTKVETRDTMLTTNGVQVLR